MTGAAPRVLPISAASLSVVTNEARPIRLYLHAVTGAGANVNADATDSASFPVAVHARGGEHPALRRGAFVEFRNYSVKSLDAATLRYCNSEGTYVIEVCVVLARVQFVLRLSLSSCG